MIHLTKRRLISPLRKANQQKKYYYCTISSHSSSEYEDPYLHYIKQVTEKEIKKQQGIMDIVYQKLKLNSFDDWYNVPRSKIVENGGFNVIRSAYSGDLQKLLQTLYPNYPWDFQYIKIPTKYYFSSMENQRKFMEELFEKLQLKTLDEWLTITKKKIFLNGGYYLVKNVYDNDLNKLLSSIYPNYHWNFNQVNPFTDINYQKEFMEKLFNKLKLNSLDDWNKISKNKMRREGANYLLEFYLNDKKKLLSTIYPHVNWNFDKKSKINSNNNIDNKIDNNIDNNIDNIININNISSNVDQTIDFSSIDFSELKNQQLFMDYLYKKLNLNSLDDWLKHTRKIIVQNGGRSLITNIYLNKFKILLKNIYPNYSWNFLNTIKKNNTKEYFKSIKNQKKFMENLFEKFELKSLDDWLKISRKKIISNEGYYLLKKKYNNDKQKLLSSIYPDHPWQFNKINNIDLIIDENSCNKYDNYEKNNSINNYYSDFNNQKKLIDKIFIKLNLNSIDDWTRISRREIIENGGRILFRIYKTKEKLFKTMYPNYQWNLNRLEFQNKKFSNAHFSSIENQRNFMDNLYIKYNLKSFDDWYNFSRKKIRKEVGGNFLILNCYEKDMKKLLLNVYPNYSWNFENYRSSRRHSLGDLQSLDNQRKLMDQLFHNFNLKSIDDWGNISKKKLILRGGKLLIKNIYKNDMRKLLSTIYPENNWEFLIKKEKKILWTIENQRKYAEKLFYQLKLKSLDDWKSIKKFNIYNTKIKRIVYSYHSNNFENFLNAIYPNYPWKYVLKKNDYYKMKSIDQLRNLFDQLFDILHLKTLDDWFNITRRNILNVGSYGKRLLKRYLYYNHEKIFQKIYPNFPWEFEKRSMKLVQNYLLLNTIDKQHKFMKFLFDKFQLKTLDDWLYISKQRISLAGGRRLLSLYYSNNANFLLSSLYPNFPWQFEKRKFNQKEFYLTSMENIRSFCLQLVEDLHLKSLDDLLTISRFKIKKNGGRSLLKLVGNEYENDFAKFLNILFPDFPWQRNDFSLIENQAKFLDYLYYKLNLKTFKDWIKVRPSNIRRHGGSKILDLYSCDPIELLSTVYRNYPWNLSALRRSESNKIQYRILLRDYQLKYLIREQKDWYRLPVDNYHTLFYILKIIHPNEKWKKIEFLHKGKRTKQRQLFVSAQLIYPLFLMIENYRNNEIDQLEFDIFIPELNLALEYQGEHHYDDMPLCFNSLDLYQARDRQKSELSKLLGITLIYVPYWWDNSVDSLRHSILSSFPFTPKK